DHASGSASVGVGADRQRPARSRSNAQLSAREVNFAAVAACGARVDGHAASRHGDCPYLTGQADDAAIAASRGCNRDAVGKAQFYSAGSEIVVDVDVSAFAGGAAGFGFQIAAYPIYRDARFNCECAGAPHLQCYAATVAGADSISCQA